ncbi:uncharacterized protein LOC119990481 [Tripterygium wilfordii]|uniref:uncharacterized protein LOC119990481 n=1 Tax=Tripterygium wilfordii TaxID=458696 RepID=UPI0018F85F59|nr:uncharacterized protein LOC119990481 [Tripterygium wilfordii]
MATMCFGKAGDTIWERRSKAESLKANANRMRGLNPLEANERLREAAEIFEDIGRADSVAKCFFELGEYERAGEIYLEKCEEKLKEAGECFSLAGCYNRAAEVYARGKFFCECLSACYDGKLFNLGFQYIQSWRLLEVSKVGTSEGRGKFDASAQKLLEGGALYHYKLKDSGTMMKFVKAFYSDNAMRTFLKKVGCLDELLHLEMEWGNHLEAANVAELKGDLLMAADILEGGGHLKDASMLILCFVFGKSLWEITDQGWPLKPFTEKRELLMKAKRIANNVSSHFYEFICTEANILSDELYTLPELKRLLSD